jgi:4-hydroxyphenylpyruvate dioxygenase
MSPETASPTNADIREADFMPLHGIDHVELYVGNALQAAYYYMHAFGFCQVAYAGLETGSRDKVSHVLQSGRIRLVLSGALGAESPIAVHQHKHGDGVKVIALSVPDAVRAFQEATARGAEPVTAPHTTSDAFGSATLASIKTYGATIHTFVERTDYDGPFLPGYVASELGEDTEMLVAVDHIVGNTEDMNPWVKYYEDVFGMREMLHFSDEDISTEYSALMSKVVTNGSGSVKFPINEPATGKRKSQIEEYLEFYGGPGVQHIAVATRDIVGTVAEMRRRGVEFLTIPHEYYEEVPARVPDVVDQLDDLREQGILVDRDDDGYLLQIFTKPVEDRPTMFFEVIERHGARGFGNGNFKALFEAIEREQAKRGNL